MALWCFPQYSRRAGRGFVIRRGRCGDRFRSRIERLRPFRPETVHGVRIGPRLFVGLGVAWNYYSARGDMPDDSFREYTDGGRSFVPIFADMKVYFLDRRISPI